MRGSAIVPCIVLACAVAGVAAGGHVPVAAAPPAGAAGTAESSVTQAASVWTVVAGNFTGDSRDESFWYTAGATPDVMVSSSNGGTVSGDLEEDIFEYRINKPYRPFTGDFDGNGFDEIFWYAPGSAADSIWRWPANDFRHPTSRSISVSGSYTPLVGDFNGDHTDDILWYAPGSSPDSLWYFRHDESHASVAYNIKRTYRPVVASVGKDATDDIVWYAPGNKPDTIWDFTFGSRSFTSKSLVVNGSSYRPIAIDALGDGSRGTDLWFYAPGSAADPFWEIRLGVKDTAQNLPLGGNWQAAVGDFLGDGREDAYLSNSNVGYTLRNFTEDAGQNVWVDYNYRFSSTQTAGSEQPPLAPIEGDGPYVIGTTPPQTPDTP